MGTGDQPGPSGIRKREMLMRTDDQPGPSGIQKREMLMSTAARPPSPAVSSDQEVANNPPAKQKSSKSKTKKKQKEETDQMLHQLLSAMLQRINKVFGTSSSDED